MGKTRHFEEHEEVWLEAKGTYLRFRLKTAPLDVQVRISHVFFVQLLSAVMDHIHIFGKAVQLQQLPDLVQQPEQMTNKITHLLPHCFKQPGTEEQLALEVAPE